MNKFKIGDIVGHKETPELKFRILSIMEAIDEKQPFKYGYGYQQFFDGDNLEDEMTQIFSDLGSSMYPEADLFFIRNPTKIELERMFEEAEIQKETFIDLGEDIMKRIKEITQ